MGTSSTRAPAHGALPPLPRGPNERPPPRWPHPPLQRDSMGKSRGDFPRCISLKIGAFRSRETLENKQVQYDICWTIWDILGISDDLVFFF